MNTDVMKSYEELFGKRYSQTSVSDQCHPNEAIARIVQNPDGSRRLESTGLADTTSPEFQRLLGPQGSLASRLGLPGIGSTGCPTGATGCTDDPFFHFPDLDRDSGDCLYIPTFNDVPVTISMLTYLFDAFFKEVPFQEVQQTIDQESKTIINDIVYGNIYFNYIPLTVLLLVVIWVFIIHGTINWETGVLLTAVIITVLWLSYALFDSYSRGVTGNTFTQIYDEVRDNFEAKNEAIICNILKGYYTAVNHMILPEAAICSSPTGPLGPCDLFDTGIEKTISTDLGDQTVSVKIPNPAIIINDQIGVGGDQRCNGIDNNQTLLPIIDDLCPCISDIEGFDLSILSQSKKEELFDCILDKLPEKFVEKTSIFGVGTCKDNLECLAFNCLLTPDLNLGLCKLANNITCSTADVPVLCNIRQ